MSFKVVIPARLASQRLPGKPLRLLAGREMVGHVIDRARESGAGEVVVATESEQVMQALERLGADGCLTSNLLESGTDRVAEVAALRRWPAETVVVNLQGDEPLMPAVLIDQVAQLLEHDDAPIATLATPLGGVGELLDPNLVKVVCDASGGALYFSRAPIPWSRDTAPEGIPSQRSCEGARRHIGLYAYRVSALRRLTSEPPAPLEQLEKLEQLRALWLGMRIRVGEACAVPGPGVDTEADLALVAAIMEGGPVL